jgi:hypothetical protein
MSTELIAAQEFDLQQRRANALSKSTLIPKDFQANVSNCMIALDIADSLGMKPLPVLQNLYIVHGKPAWSSQFLIAAFNQCGKFSGITYTFVGDPASDNYGCFAKAIDLRTGELLQGPLVTIAIAKKEGWYSKSGSKWQTMPELMMRYRAATFLVRTTAPELTMGLPMQEEMEDIQPVNTVTIESLRQQQKIGSVIEVAEPITEDVVGGNL